MSEHWCVLFLVYGVVESDVGILFPARKVNFVLIGEIGRILAVGRVSTER